MDTVDRKMKKQGEAAKMAKRKITTIGKNIDKDVELCRSTNRTVVSHTIQSLIDARIPITQNWIRIPFYKRERYSGAKEICVIRTHRNQYSRARKILDTLEIVDRERLVLHAV